MPIDKIQSPPKHFMRIEKKGKYTVVHAHNYDYIFSREDLQSIRDRSLRHIQQLSNTQIEDITLRQAYINLAQAADALDALKARVGAP